MELLSQAFGANETKVFHKAGRYFEVITAPFPFARVEFGATPSGGGGQTDSMLNPQSGLFVEDSFGYFTITNGAFPQTITVLVMENGRGGSRRQPGSVQVINGSYDRTAVGQQLLGRTGGTPAGGNQRIVGLRLTAAGAAAGKRLAVKALRILSTIAGQVSLGYTNQASGFSATAQIFNKLADTSASNFTEMVTQDAAATFNWTIGTTRILDNPWVKANEELVIPFTDPILFGTTYALGVGGGATGARDIQVTFEAEEVG